MSELSDPLYRRDLLRLAADASAAGRLPAPDASGTAHNPACGDRVTVDLELDAGRIAALRHHTHACVLAQASAAILAQAAVGLDRQGLAALSLGVGEMLRQGAPPPRADYAVFDGVAAHAGRHRCVLLPLEAALMALESGEVRS
jgi:NifU-like protein involved in Fe-S cluster formation